MIQKFRVEFCTHEYMQMTIASEGELNGFPMLSIDSESYIDGGEIQSGMNFLPYEGRHCIAIGKSCSLATDIVFMIDMNHNYNSVFQGALPSIFNTRQFMTTPRKASIIIQNDVWVGYGVTIMAGVTLHNGCVVAAGSVVTKDVPPYAIVGGNPAKIIRYRFDPEIIDGLQKIAWWDWPNEWKNQRRDDFIRPVEEFVEKYLSLVDKCPPFADNSANMFSGRNVVLFVPDVKEPYPVYPDVLRQYFAVDRPNVELLLYLPQEDSDKKSLRAIEKLLNKYADRDCYVTLQAGTTLDERALMRDASYFVTTRSRPTVYRTCLADSFQTKILYGTDKPIFPESLR